MGYKLELLTDSDLLKLAEGRVVTDYRDFKFSSNKSSKLTSYAGGVYDHNLFGSVYENTCNCGRTYKLGTRCTNCGVEVISEEEKDKRYAVIDLTIYYLMPIHNEIVLSILNRIDLRITDDVYKYLEFSRLSKSSITRFLYWCNFSYDSTTKSIVASMDYKNIESTSIEGLLVILKDYYPSEYNQLLKYLHKYVLVTPATHRTVSYNPYDARTSMTIPSMTAAYQSLLYARSYIWDFWDTETLENKVALNACLRASAEVLITEISGLLRTSKENESRLAFSQRITKSGRAVITADPDLTIDEVGIPFTAAYSIMKSDFIQLLQDKFSINYNAALELYINADANTCKVFKEYAETRYVLVNRPPSLHRYNLMTHKVKLVNDSTMHFPITAVLPYNADYDGDALMYYLIPKNQESEFIKNTLPSNNLKYESTMDYIFKPTQDILYGMYLSTIIQPVEDKSKLKSYQNRLDLFNDWDNKLIDFATEEVLVGDKVTTYAYEKLSDLLGYDVFTILGKVEPINSRNIALILKVVQASNDYANLYKSITNHALMVVTLEGVTIPDFHTIIKTSFTDDKILNDAIAKSKTDKKYNLVVSERYYELLKNSIDSAGTELLSRINAANRIKTSQVTDIFSPSLFVDNNGNYSVAESSLSSSMKYEDFLTHAINNRYIMKKKYDITPKGGYLSRQLRYVSQYLKFNAEDLDKDNKGLLLPKRLVAGRTMIDGTEVPESDSDELIKVRSVVVSELPYITKDLVPKEFQNFKTGSNISLKVGSASTGQVTQSGLSLKHGGTVYKLSDSKLIARNNCIIEQDGNHLNITEGNITYKHPVPSTFILFSTKCKKGEVIGFCNEFITPELLSDYLIDFLGGKNTSDIANSYRKSHLSINLSPYKGVVSFKDGFTIGGNSVPYDSRRLYSVLEGDEVEVGDRISDGILDTNKLASLNVSNQIVYYLFATQLSTVMPSFTLFTIELLFRLLTKYEDGKLSYKGIVSAIQTHTNLLTAVSFENSKRVLSNISEGNFHSDTFSDYLLSLITK